MINYTSAPPTHININDNDYPVNIDFKVWIEVSEVLQTLDFRQEFYLNEIQSLVSLVFPIIPNEPLDLIIIAMSEFIKGYPTIQGSISLGQQSERVYSFMHDINYIIIAIHNQSGINLSYRNNIPFHWWDFLLEFKALEDRHYISKIIGYRAYEGKDKDMLKLKQYYALPRFTSEFEKELLNSLIDDFYEC